VKKYEIIILSGGKGTRIKKFTKKIPKCLIDINGKPFLYYQLRYLKKYGIKKVILSVGYKSEEVKNYVKNNINFIDVKIVKDGKKLLGTGGAIIKSIKFLKNNFFILYGDSYLNFDLNKLRSIKNRSIMAIYKNKNKHDKSNIKLIDPNYIHYFKNTSKLRLSYIDYGISFLNKKIFKNLDIDRKFDLSSLFDKVSKNFQLHGLIIKKRFYEVGSYNGIKELRKYLKK
jgi:D-glycero-alpha-D-manno-heptose 1-phosphate guanylyltransferase|tara:strand:+ start:1143 stop:1826 length:684 start_codon:yes stop_codon:yes gene_type:complete